MIDTQRKTRAIVSALVIALGFFLYVKVARSEVLSYDVLETIAQGEGAPPMLMLAICWRESKHKASRINKSDPSYGLCQVMFPTAQQVGYKGDIKGLLNPYVNIKHAAKYLAWQIKRYRGNWIYAIAAYNAGSVLRNRKGKIVNIEYVNNVIKFLERMPWITTIQY